MGSGRSKKYVVYFDEVTTTKAFSTRSLKPLVVVENGEAGPSFTSPDEALIDSSVGDGRLPTDDDE